MKTIMILLNLIAWPAAAQTFVGSFVTVKGDVKVLVSPGPQDQGPFMLFDGVKYSYSSAKIGKKVKPGEVVQSGADGRAKIVYPNGDHFVIGPGTSMVLPAVQGEGQSEAKNTSLKIIYGRVRALVSKTGPRKGMKVETPAAVAGVRGTDFFTRVNPTVGTQLTVLRGEVALSNAEKPEATVSVKTGFMAEAEPKSTAPAKIIEATKQELIAVQSETTVKVSETEIKALDPQTKQEYEALQSKAKDAILNDIKVDDPDMYKEMKKRKDLDANEINTMVVAKLFKMAPSDMKKKPSAEEIDAIGRDVYDKYFKGAEKK